ncbi:MAG: serine hydrolase [Bacteroidetes bacterium]|nr:serine hydrolase [Bacteroidota bacterium]
MKNFMLPVIVSLTGLIFCTHVIGQNSSLANIDEFILNEMEQLHKPGIAACIIKGDSIVWSRNYGYAILEDSLPVSDTTLFTVCSVGKSITAACVLQLWDDGLLDLDENINNFLPFQIDNPNVENDSITARMLMIHTSSIVDYNPGAYISIGDPTVTLGYFCENYLSPGGAYYYGNNFLNAIPGTTDAYSTAGSALNGYLVEPLTGMNYNDYAREYLFNPLNMERSAWLLSELNISNLAIGYDFSGGSYNPHPHYGVSAYPGATLRSNVFELAHFVIMLMNGGNYNFTQVLSAATIDSMTTLQSPLFLRGLGLTHNDLWNYHGTFTREIWGHNGGDNTLAFAATIQFCPVDNTGIVYLSNSSTQPENIKKKLFDYAAMIVIADSAIEISDTQFTAQWQFAPDASGYFLDVALNEEFTYIVEGYENLDVGSDINYQVSDLSSNTEYFYRMRAYNENDTGAYSNTIGLTTLLGNGFVNKLNTSIKVWSRDKTVFIELPQNTGLETSATLYSLTGQQLRKTILTDGMNSIRMDIRKQPIIIKINAGNNSYCKKVMVW